MPASHIIFKEDATDPRRKPSAPAEIPFVPILFFLLECGLGYKKTCVMSDVSGSVKTKTVVSHPTKCALNLGKLKIIW